ncbi:MAG: abnormal spindle-like microcephaly-associated protein [Trebouxia sp. A1-2]|nr:MAG: abnormal spindle-like microcephaly-associated protein [Trebouxia sp. A1-2]
MRATPVKEHSKPACTLELKKFLQAPILDFGSIKAGVCKSLELVLSNPDQQEQTSTLHDSLRLLWRRTQLQVVLSGKATAPPQSALMHAAVKRTVSDISNTPFEAGFALPQTPTGQKVVKSQRVGSISPGHPTFEAALRNSTAATPSRRQAADNTLGLSRYALEAAPDTLALPAAQSQFADRLTEVAISDQPAPPKRPQVRLKRSAGAVPLRLWIEKQEGAFLAWLNSVLVPAKATEEGPAGQALAARRLAAKVRGLLWHLYSADTDVIASMLKVEKHIDAGQLRLKDEEAQLADVKWHQAVFEVLLSYHPFWLRLGLETVVGQLLPANTGERKTRRERLAELLDFANDTFLHDQDLAQQHALNITIEGLYSEQYWVHLGQVVLKRFLLLVLLLDRAALSDKVPSSAPPLFKRDGLCKKSSQVVTTLLNGRMFGEGNMMRHLSQLTYKLLYTQDPLAEFDFSLVSMSADLKDGLRLCKLAEALTGQQNVMPASRFPAARRPQQLHNVALALNTMQKAGLSVQLPKLVDSSKLRSEVQRILSKTRHSKRQQHSSTAPEAGEERLAVLLSWCQAVCGAYGLTVVNFRTSFADARGLCLLMSYYLPSYLSEEQIFVPPRAATDRLVMEAYSEQDLAFEGTVGDIDVSSLDEAARQTHIAGVKSNLHLAQAAALALGDVPPILSAPGFLEHGPDEKATVIFLSFLCARVLEVSKEDRAAQVIQHFFRQRKSHKPGQGRASLLRWIAAAQLVQRAFKVWQFRQGLIVGRRMRSTLQAATTQLQAMWRARQPFRSYQALRHAAIRTQAVARGSRVRRRVHEIKVLAPLLSVCLQKRAALIAARVAARVEALVIRLQAIYRGARQRRAYMQDRQHVVRLQAAFRAFPARMQFLQAKGAAIWIQSCWRRLQAQQHVLRTKAAVAIQKHWRAYRVRTIVMQQQIAAIVIQQHWRGQMAQPASQQAVQTAQGCNPGPKAAWRRCMGQRAFRRQRNAAVALQLAWRRHSARQLLRCMKAAVMLQAAWRGFAARKERAIMSAAAITVQSRWRAARQHRIYKATIRQSIWRGHQARLLLRRVRAAVVLQTAYRGAAVRCKAVWRGKQARKHAARLRAAITVQATWRDRALRMHMARQQAAALCLQAHWRGYACKRIYLATKAHIVQVQAAVRGHRARTRFVEQRKAACLVQAHWRRLLAHRLVHKTQAVVTVQRFVRGWMARQLISRRQRAATCIQSYVRMRVQYLKFRSVLEMRAAMREFARAARDYSRRYSAAIKMQSLARGFLARRAFAQVVAAHHHQLRLEQAKAAAALAVIAPWAATFVARCHFLRLRRATRLVQHSWRATWALRNRAAVQIQSALRMYLAKQRLRKSCCAACAWWRGGQVRMHAGRRKAQMRKRLQQAAVAAAQDPHRQLGHLTRGALQQLLAAKHLPQASAAMATLSMCSSYSKGCCSMIAEGGGVTSLLQFIRGCNRSQPHVDLLKHAVAILAHLSRYQQLHSSLLASSDCVQVLAEQLQMFRDKEDMFLAVITVVDRLVAVPQQAVLIGHMTPAVKQMEAVAQILLRKVDTESKYLARLEGQKGSDVSAREATRKLVAATKQMHALHAILQDVHASEVGPQKASEATDKKLQSSDEDARSAAAAAGPWAAKNTIVRDVLHELTNAAQKSRTKHRYSAHQISAGQLVTSASPAKQ